MTLTAFASEAVFDEDRTVPAKQIGASVRRNCEELNGRI